MNLKTFILGLLFLSISSSHLYAQEKLDSIYWFLENSKTIGNKNLNTKLIYALRAMELSENAKVDSLIVQSHLNLSNIYLYSKNYDAFKKYSRSVIRLAENMSDSVSMAMANKNLGYFFYDRLVDSAYYYNNKAEKLFRALGDNYNTAIVLLDIALLQKDEKDFTGSEINSIKGISLLDRLNSSREVLLKKSFFYNNLGNVFDQLEQFDESIKYHQKAIELKKSLEGDNKVIIDNSLNNLALSYKNSGEYAVALDYYQQILENKNLVNERPDFYALVLDNYSHCLYLSDKLEQIPELFLKALKITDSISEAGYNSIIINQHLAEYYHDNNQNDSAKYYAYRAKSISEKYHNDDLLKSLKLLSVIEDGDNSAKHLKDYVQLSDSLQKSERRIRNKFARIRFETEQIEQENIQIAKERLWLLIISVVVVIASFLLYLVITQRNKNRELKFVQKQQETNEEIYNLMLSQNETIEEARTLEKKRISQELHDGVLGRLFGTRLSLDSLNMNNTVEAIKTRSEYIDGLKTIEEDIRKVSHELNTDFVSGSGFIDIIKTLIETQTLAYGLKYDLKHDDAIIWDELDNKKKIHMYRIVQESLHNIYKHAKATHVSISFKLKKNVICFTLKDDGSGFDVTKAKSGIGLKNMNSRIKEIAGNIDIKSEINTGTTVIIEVPTT